MNQDQVLTEDEEVGEPPILGYADVLGATDFRQGYIKCRLVHLADKSFVIPDILLASGLHKKFFSPRFFQPNQILWFGGDGSGDFCRFVITLGGNVDVNVAFFRKGVVKQCADNSLIYKCAFRPVNNGEAPVSQGVWRRRDDRFEIALFHHTDAAGEAGIRASKEIWSSPKNIQGVRKLSNVAYGYFTSLPRITSTFDLWEIAMSDSGYTHFLPTNAPPDAQFAHALNVYQQDGWDRNRPLRFWVNLEVIAPNHLWLHKPEGDATYYEVVLPRVFRVGVEPGRALPIRGTLLDVMPSDCKRLGFVIVGDADTENGLKAPFHEEETLELAKIDEIPKGNEIIGRWQDMQNRFLFSDMKVEYNQFAQEES
jgi:hypothetical protein